MKVLTRAVTALLAGPALVLVGSCSAAAPPQAPAALPAAPAAPAAPQAAPVAAQQNPADQDAAPVGYLQLGHLAPNAPTFNGYFARFGDDGQLFARGGYGFLSPYFTLPPGRYVWSMRPADSPPDSPLTLTKLIEVKEGEASSVVLFNNGPQGSLQGVVTPDDTAAPPAGTGKIKMIQGASGAPVSVSVGEQPARELAYGTVTPYQNVPAGRVTIRVAGADSPTTVDVAPGSLHTVLVTRAEKGTMSTSVTDSIVASPLSARTPTGANTGSGGLAASSTSSPMLVNGLAGGGAVLMLIAWVILLAGRRRNT